jgi:hypothetical protein
MRDVPWGDVNVNCHATRVPGAVYLKTIVGEATPLPMVIFAPEMAPDTSVGGATAAISARATVHRDMREAMARNGNGVRMV